LIPDIRRRPLLSTWSSNTRKNSSEAILIRTSPHTTARSADRTSCDNWFEIGGRGIRVGSVRHFRREKGHQSCGTSCGGRTLRARWLICEGSPELLFSENETNNQRLFGAEPHTIRSKMESQLRRDGSRDACESRTTGTTAYACNHSRRSRLQQEPCACGSSDQEHLARVIVAADHS